MRLLKYTLIIFVLIQLKIIYAQQDYTVEHFDIDNGLPRRHISCILKDRIGYLWIGTNNCLYRYDGYQFKEYLQGTDANKFIRCILEDQSGTLWVGTGQGLNKYNRRTDSFNLYNMPIDTSALKAVNDYRGTSAICEDRNRNFWVGTRSALYNFNTKKGIFTLVKGKSGELNKLSSKSINVIFEDKWNNLWIGTGHNLLSNGGLNLFDPSSETIKKFAHDPLNPESLVQNRVLAIYQDKLGGLWIGTDGGLDKFEYTNQTFIHFKHDSHNVNSLNSDYIRCLSEDDDGNLLIGTWAGGLNKYNLKSKKFSAYSLNMNKHAKLNINENANLNITKNSLYRDHSGIIWIGTVDGLYKITPQPKSFFRAQNSVKNAERIRNMLKGLQIFAMYRDNRGVIWIGSDDGVKSINPDLSIGPAYLNGISSLDNNSIFKDKSNKIWFGSVGGLYVIDIKTKKFIRYIHDPYNPNSISDNQITSIAEDSNGVIWLGTFNHGIEKYDKKRGTFKHFPLNPPDSLTQIFNRQEVRSMFVDSRGILWAGTNKGLAKFNPSDETFKWYITHSNDVNNLWYYKIYGFLEDHNNEIWLATYQGLVSFDKKSDTFTLYGKANNLADEDVISLLEDKHGKIWLATDAKISMFNPKTKRFKNFGKRYGLYGDYSSAACKDSSGNFYFGSYGIVIFNPDSLYSDSPAPPIVLTDFKVSDRSAQLDSSISVKKNIELTYRQNDFTIEFSALNFINSHQNQYTYKLEGFNIDWIYCGTRHHATYMNLNYGTFTFRVIGANSDEVWNKKGTSLTITILPPWWKTTWAYISYAFIFVFVLYGIRRYELNRMNLKNKVAMDENILKEREETDKIKSRFFANISHEFRTPLTLILGPVEKIVSRTSDESIKNDAGIIKRNSKRLLQLVNQLLDLSSLEAGKLKLNASKNNIVSFVKGVVLSFESLYEEKDITLKISSEKEFIEMYFDKEKMIKILTNILSNALKYTKEDGKITVSITENSGLPGEVLTKTGVSSSVEIKIRDTGIGIAKEEIPKLFNRFYQVDSSFIKEHQGTGIGLALTKELVELHQGTISVESEIGKWTEFTLKFPAGREHLKDEEISINEDEDRSKTIISEENYFITKEAEEIISESIEIDLTEDDKLIILIVEDNYDMREYIKESLGEDYRIEEAVNGEQGVRKAEKIIPDLIISDMMMPKMDGNELIRILRNNEKTSHIPIIILTAKTSQESKLEGLETGADDYLTKPFNTKELQIRIANLIKIRKRLQEKFGKGEFVSGYNGDFPQSIQSGMEKLRNIDKKFIDKVMKIINEHIADEGFSIVQLGNEVGMSRSQIHRKIRALTGLPPNSCVRKIRLFKAKEMIKNGDGNISEISYSVGFSSPVYFSKCFKEEFGFPPKNLTE